MQKVGARMKRAVLGFFCSTRKRENLLQLNEILSCIKGQIRSKLIVKVKM